MILRSPLCIFILIFFLYLSRIQSISILSSSSIEKCINDNPSGNIKCSSKIILSLTIQNAELQGSDYIETTLNQITDNDGNTQKLVSPIKITFSKTPVEVIYPATYYQDFNYGPKEKIISTTSLKCKDSNTESNPTCGWAMSNGERIPYSQGFCCSCSFLSLSDSIKRGTKCDGILETKASAHCMVYDELWYSAYKVDKYKIDYKIEIILTDIKDNKIISTLELSPQNIISIDDNKNILVKLIGDFLPNDLFPRDLSNKFLLIPTSPKNHINVKQGTYNWMLVDKTKFSLDGNECDKIGVGFKAFNSQSEKCNVESGSCLKNQIYHLYQSDIQKIQKNENPEYLLKYDRIYKYNFKTEEFYSRSFSYYLSGNINTLITLEINADILKFVTNVSAGKIIHLNVSDFMAMSEDGYFEVGVMNTGFFIAQYILIYECNSNIIKISSDEISLKPDESKYFNKSVFTNTKSGQENKCAIILKNSLGETIDMKIISFNTTDEVAINSQNISVTNDSVEGIFRESNSDFSCEALCTKVADFSCYIENSCWVLMMERLLIIFCFILILAIFVKVVNKIFCCCKYIKKIFCCCLCNSKKKKNKKVESSDE